ncbi:MAG: hypothetical protein M3Y85_04405, partial [Bacteroidota bacterium]|nr:hypothetical protein [Bacteroidota bacterium]
TGTGSGLLPAHLGISNRGGNTPSDYKATIDIEFTDGFESGEGDSFEAFITDDNSGGRPSANVAEGGSDYRYGFNGKENDNDIEGERNSYDYGLRIYDPRIGKFLSIDPLDKKFPYWSPYHFAGDNPIRFIDLDGGEILDPFTKWVMTDVVITIIKNPTSAKAKSYGALIGVGGAVQGAAQGTVNLIVHPIESGKGLWRMLTNSTAGNMADYAIRMQQTYGDLPDPVKGYAIGGHLFGEIGIALLPFKGVFKIGSLAKVDLMGGTASKLGTGWINFDRAARVGIADDVANFSNHFAKGSVKEIVANNPRAEFLGNVTEALQGGGTITVRGQMANGFFKEIWNGTAKGMEGYNVVNGSKKTGLSTEGYFQEGNKPLRGDANSLNEIILKKK